MEKIVLTDKHIEVIKKQLNGEIEIWTDDEDVRRYLGEVIDMADERLQNMPEDYDFGTDLILWFWNEYKAQEGIEE